ncbi:MAG: flagellar motor protein MotB [Bryobacteraceae bacterium]
MARKAARAEHENHERWLISYADFITLLFALFVVMFAVSQTDKHKAHEVSDSMKQALENSATKPAAREILGGTVDSTGKGNAMMRGPGGSQKQIVKTELIPPSEVTITDLVPSMNYLTQALVQEIKEGKVDVHLEERGLVVSLRQAAFFPSGGDEIGPQTHDAMAKIAGVIKSLPNGVRLEGHTDSVPIHNAHFRSNWELSAARAIAMLELLATQYDIPRERFGIAGYADTIPVDSNDTPEGRMHNRRVDIAILNQRVVTSLEPGSPPLVGAAKN